MVLGPLPGQARLGAQPGELPLRDREVPRPSRFRGLRQGDGLRGEEEVQDQGADSEGARGEGCRVRPAHRRGSLRLLVHERGADRLPRGEGDRGLRRRGEGGQDRPLRRQQDGDEPRRVREDDTHGEVRACRGVHLSPRREAHLHGVLHQREDEAPRRAEDEARNLLQGR